jgi:hypothetical protein
MADLARQDVVPKSLNATRPRQMTPTQEDASPVLDRCILTCPRALVGRIIGKHGTTVNGIQLFTKTLIEIDQASDPSTIVILGTPDASNVAASIITDILSSTFKGFKMLRELSALSGSSRTLEEGQFVYCPGVGMFPQHQVRGVGHDSVILLMICAQTC